MCMAERPESLSRRSLLSFSILLILGLFAALVVGCAPGPRVISKTPSFIGGDMTDSIEQAQNTSKLSH